RNRHDPRLLSEQPCQGDLARGSTFASRDAGEEINDGLVVLQRVRFESRDSAADVVAAIKAGRGVDGAGEEALAKRAVGDEADAQFLTCGEYVLFGSPPPQR